MTDRYPLDNLLQGGSVESTLQFAGETWLSLRAGRVELYDGVEMALSSAERIDLMTDAGVKEITLLIGSVGGQIHLGMILIRAIQRAQRADVKVTGEVRGIAMSMGFDILQFCDHRIMHEGDVLMAHGMTDFMVGDQSDAEAAALLFEYYQEFFAKQVQRRVAATRPGCKFDDVSFWLAAFKRATPIYIFPEKALENGLVDEIRSSG